MNTLEKFGTICYSMYKKNNKWFYWEKLLESYSNEDDYDILKTKINNFIVLLNEKEDEYLNKDIETEIWDNI
jgi:hypothetical protein